MSRALIEAVRDAAVRTFRDALGREVTPLPPQPSPAESSVFQTSVIISFVGAISGAFALRCSRKTGAAIAAQMLGTEVPETSDDMKDAVGEFLNMVVGDAKTRFSTDGEAFRISVPTTVVGDRYVLHVSSGGSDTVSTLWFGFGSEALCIEIYLK